MTTPGGTLPRIKHGAVSGASRGVSSSIVGPSKSSAAAAAESTRCAERLVMIRQRESALAGVDRKGREQLRGLGGAGVLAHLVARAGALGPALAGAIDPHRLVVDLAA